MAEWVADGVGLGDVLDAELDEDDAVLDGGVVTDVSGLVDAALGAPEVVAPEVQPATTSTEISVRRTAMRLRGTWLTLAERACPPS